MRADAEAVVTALSVRYRFSRANGVQLLRDQGILPQREPAAEEEDDVGGGGGLGERGGG